MGKYPVTQAQWKAVGALPEINRRFFKANQPVEDVWLSEVMKFCALLSKKTGKIYRLPSEAQWEYACRAGTTTPFHFGETITADLANYGSYREEKTDVGSFPPNAFGLYDMHGNVWELCADPWHENYHGAPLDGSVWESGGKNYFRLLRGGSWYADPSECRSAYRSNFDTCFGEYDFGFRVVCSSPWTP